MPRIVCVSDTHMAKPELPAGDILIHSGDLTSRGTQAETVEMLEWLAEHPHAHKILVAGNHDFFFDKDAPASYRSWSLARTRDPNDVLADYPNITYLQDGAADAGGLKLYGSPWQPYYFGWAFNYPEFDDQPFARRLWSKIPTGTQILVTHTPPLGVLDSTYPNDSRKGCPELLKRLGFLTSLRLHAFGHIHEAYGRSGSSNLTFVNASIMTREYQPLNAPIVVDLETHPTTSRH